VVVYISPGTAASPALHDGDTVHTRRKSAIADVTKDVGKIGPAVSALASQVNDLNTKITRLRARSLPQMPDVSARMSRITAKATRGNGTIALATRTNLMGRASHAMAAADSIRTLLSSNKGSLGRFRRDSTLVTKAKGVMAEVDTLRFCPTRWDRSQRRIRTARWRDSSPALTLFWIRSSEIPGLIAPATSISDLTDFFRAVTFG